jgi:hypothetical protein
MRSLSSWVDQSLGSTNGKIDSKLRAGQVFTAALVHLCTVQTGCQRKYGKASVRHVANWKLKQRSRKGYATSVQGLYEAGWNRKESILCQARPVLNVCYVMLR